MSESQALRRRCSPSIAAVVVSGSCSPVTDRQIAWALANGFAEVPLDTAGLAAIESTRRGHCRRLPNGSSRRELDAGRSVIVHTSRGPDDDRIARPNNSASTASRRRRSVLYWDASSATCCGRGRVAASCRDRRRHVGLRSPARSASTHWKWSGRSRRVRRSASPTAGDRGGRRTSSSRSKADRSVTTISSARLLRGGTESLVDRRLEMRFAAGGNFSAADH